MIFVAYPNFVTTLITESNKIYSDISWHPSAIQTIYGMDSYQHLKKVFDQFVHIAKLTLITFILTKGLSTVTDNKSV